MFDIIKKSIFTSFSCFLIYYKHIKTEYQQSFSRYNRRIKQIYLLLIMRWSLNNKMGLLFLILSE